MLLPQRSAAQDQRPATVAPVYTVEVYDPARDPAEDLAATVRRAQAEGKRILMQVGGEWCTWCHALNRFVHENERVARALRRDFLIMKVNYSEENRNEAFLEDYPPIPGYPHLFVLESDGRLLHAQGTAELEEGPSYNEAVVLAFLERWAPPAFRWPEGKQAALSLSFDDGRPSQVDVGLPLLDRTGARVTFYVVPGAVEQRLEGWRELAERGHEIGNHSLNHPCTGNFAWAREKALEEHTLETIRYELEEANRRVEQLLGVVPETFAYPCGQTFVGRGVETRSYVPVVAEHFTAGRGWLDENANDPTFVDLAQVLGTSMDAQDFDEIRPLLEAVQETGGWLVLAGHDIGEEGPQTVRADMLEQLIAYAQDPVNGLWLAPVGTVAEYIAEQRQGGQEGASIGRR